MGTLETVLVVAKNHELSKTLHKGKASVQASDLTRYRSVIVHDSAKHEIPWSVNMIEGSQRFFVSSIAQKITAILSGIGIGHLPKGMVHRYIESGQLVVIELAEKTTPKDLYIAWKISNKGKGLKALISILSDL
jgi:DNA-binding transcriptional LysR family regulator